MVCMLDPLKFPFAPKVAPSRYNSLRYCYSRLWALKQCWLDRPLNATKSMDWTLLLEHLPMVDMYSACAALAISTKSTRVIQSK